MTLSSGDRCYSTNTLAREAPRVAINQTRLRITDAVLLEDPAAHGAALIRAGETIIDEKKSCSAVTDRKRQIGAHNHLPRLRGRLFVRRISRSR